MRRGGPPGLSSDRIGNGQLRAAAGAAAGKDLAAVLGGHAGAEAMHLRALALLGLIRSDRRCHSEHTPYDERLKIDVSPCGLRRLRGALFHAKAIIVYFTVNDEVKYIFPPKRQKAEDLCALPAKPA